MKYLKTFENWTGSIEGFGNKAEAEMRRSGEEIMRRAREEAERRKAAETKCNCDNCDCENCDEEGCDCGCCCESTFNESKTTYRDIERFLYKSYKERPTDDDAELAERAIMNPDFQDVAEEMEDNEWPFTIANQIIKGDFY